MNTLTSRHFHGNVRNLGNIVLRFESERDINLGSDFGGMNQMRASP